jgi:hypothetical protein
MSEESNKLEQLLEVIGSAVGLTLIQMVALYFLLAIRLFHTDINMFLLYRRFFEKVLFVFDRLYFLTMEIMYRLFGDSYLHVIGFNNVFKLTFFTIFLINLAYFAYSKFGSRK